MNEHLSLEGYSGANHWPIASAPDHVLDAIGARSSTVRLSPWTARKQRRRHPDLQPDDYARVQRILDRGEAFLQGEDHAMSYFEEDGRLWRAVVKVTRDRSETYLVTLHKTQLHNLDAARRRWSSIDREGERGVTAPGGS